MKHARPDYDRIQDPAGIIPEDEPVFLIRAQDRLSAVAVRYWAYLAEQACADPEIIRLAQEQADRMAAWIPRKTPDLPHDNQPAAPPKPDPSINPNST